jgi:hypothetical protein
VIAHYSHLCLGIANQNGAGNAGGSTAGDAAGTAEEAEAMLIEDNKTSCCNQCKRPLTEIDNRGEHLIGCMTCNLWATAGGKRWKRLSEEDLNALHQLNRHGRG